MPVPSPPAAAAPFDPAKVRIVRHRFSTTQGEVEVFYGSDRLNRWGDDIQLRDGEFHGLPDSFWIDAARRRVEGGGMTVAIEPWRPRMFAGLPLIPCCGRCGRVVWGEDPEYDEKGNVRHPGACPPPPPERTGLPLFDVPAA